MVSRKLALPEEAGPQREGEGDVVEDLFYIHVYCACDVSSDHISHMRTGYSVPDWHAEKVEPTVATDNTKLRNADAGTHGETKKDQDAAPHARLGTLSLGTRYLATSSISNFNFWR